MYGKTLQLELEEEYWSAVANVLRNLQMTFDNLDRQLAQIGQGALLRTTLLVTVALPQQYRRRRGPVGHGLDEHPRIGSHRRRFGNPYMDTKPKAIRHQPTQQAQHSSHAR